MFDSRVRERPADTKVPEVAPRPPAPTSWREQAACHNQPPRIFLERANFKTAKRICAACPVRDACLADQLAWEGGSHVEYRAGVFGGLTPNERHSIRTRRR